VALPDIAIERTKSAASLPSPTPLVVVVQSSPVVIVQAPKPTTSIPTSYRVPAPETSPTMELKKAPLEPQPVVENTVKAELPVSTKPPLSESSLALLDAARIGSHDSVKRWLERMADPNAVSDYGKTPLMLAAENGHHDICDTLISKGARTDIIDQRGRNALHYAAEHGHNDVVKLLVDRQVPAYAVDNDRKTPLDLALLGGHGTCAEVIRKSLQ